MSFRNLTSRNVLRFWRSVDLASLSILVRVSSGDGFRRWFVNLPCWLLSDFSLTPSFFYLASLSILVRVLSGDGFRRWSVNLLGGGRTRVCTVAGYYSTTRQLVLLNLVISITYSYFGHAVLPKPSTFRSPLDLKKKTEKLDSANLCHL